MENTPIAASPLDIPVMRSDLVYCAGDDGRAWYVKGHVPLDAFMAVLREEVFSDDTILQEAPSHCWMRIGRDFQEEHAILLEATPGSRGAFRATWIQDA